MDRAGGAQQTLQFGVLGAIELRLCGAAIDPGGYRQRRLLAALLVQGGQVVDRHALIERVWDEEDRPVNADRSIRTYVSRLRRALADAGLPAEQLIVTRAPGYCLEFDAGSAVDVHIDAHRFEELVTDGPSSADGGDPSAALLRLDSALAMWRGPPYQEFADRDWAVAEVARLVEMHQVAREQRAEVRLQLGAHLEVVPELRHLVDEDPLRSRPVEMLMRALHRSNRQAEALRVASGHRRALRDVGLDPSASLAALESRIATSEDEIERSDSARGNLPRPSSTFVGRGDDLTEFGDVLGSTRLLTLTGPGGVGKSRLAVHLASATADNYDGGAWYVALADIDSDSQVAPRVAAALEVNDWSGDTVSVLTRRLSADHSILVLDNCEHVLDGVADLAEVLLERTAGTLVCTSRESLRIDGETVRAVGPLDPEAGQVLFADRAEAAGEALDPMDPTVADICRQLDGLPLAIELVAARVPTFGLHVLGAALQDHLKRLAGRRGRVDRHRTMRAAIDWSHDLLDPAEQTVFRRVAPFAGGFTLEAATCVAALDDLDTTTIVQAVAGLVDKSMLITTAGRAGRRYRLLEPIRQNAHERLVSTDELARVHRAYVAWTVRRWTELAVRLEGPDEPAAVPDAVDEWDNLVAAAVQAARDDDLGSAYELVWCTRRFANYRAGFDVVSWAQPLLEGAGTEDAENFAEAAVIVATFVSRRADYAVAEQLVRRAVAASTKRPDEIGWRAALAEGFIESNRRRDVPASLHHYRRALTFDSSPGDQAVQHANLASLLASSAKHEARRHRTCVFELLEHDGPSPSQRALALALLAIGTNDRIEARQYAEESAELANRVGATWPGGLARGELFRITVVHDDPAAAKDMLRRMLPTLTQDGHVVDSSTVLWTSARLLTRLGMHREALLLDEAITRSGVPTLAVHDPLLDSLGPDPDRFSTEERDRIRSEAAALVRDDPGSLRPISAWLTALLDARDDPARARHN